MTKADKFFNLVQHAAKMQEKKFFLDSGEGREFETEELSGEDFSGWLIPLSDAEAFQKEWTSKAGRDIGEKWNRFIVFAIWHTDGESIIVSFDTY